MAFRTSNPMAKESVYQDVVMEGEAMTIAGSIGKTIFLLGLALISAIYTWNLTAVGLTDRALIFAVGGIVVGLIAVVCTNANPRNSMPASIIYALSEGLALGAISALYANVYNGIVIQAVLATMITVLVMLVLYCSRIVRVTPMFVKILSTATLSILLFYILVMLANYFRIIFLTPFVNAYNNIFIIGAIVAIAAFSLVFDFDFIEEGVNRKLPQYFEWYGAMTLMITIVWLYIEILRLLSRVRK